MQVFLILLILVIAAVAAMGFADMNVRDALLKITRALPASTTAVTSDAIDTGKSTTMGGQLAQFEFLITAPALTTAQLPDTKVQVYAVIHSDNANLSGSSVLYPAVITQTGADSAGAAGATHRFRLPTTAKRYIGITITPSASGTGDASGAAATLEALV